MPLKRPISLACMLFLGISLSANSQQTGFERLPVDVLDITAPSERVSGAPGSMSTLDSACRSLPAGQVRSRIIHTAIQEWAFFGFAVQDQTVTEVTNQFGRTVQRRRPRMSVEEAMRVADSIGGYWAATPDSAWIIRRQNNSWNSRGVSSRWRDPWSAAFISWVMCESGIESVGEFDRAMAHHTYIDQAILAGEQENPDTAFVAYPPGQEPIVPGDMLCRGSRPAYKTIAERRRHIGEGARTHCDIVVKVDDAKDRLMVIGGNVRGTVGMKLLPLTDEGNGQLKPAPYSNGRVIFAHLKLQAEPVPVDAFDSSPTIAAIACSSTPTPVSLLTANLTLQLPVNCKSE